MSKSLILPHHGLAAHAAILRAIIDVLGEDAETLERVADIAVSGLTKRYPDEEERRSVENAILVSLSLKRAD